MTIIDTGTVCFAEVRLMITVSTRCTVYRPLAIKTAAKREGNAQIVLNVLVKKRKKIYLFSLHFH